MNHTNMYYYTKIFISNEANRIQLNISLTLFNRKILLDSSENLSRFNTTFISNSASFFSSSRLL